MWYIYELSYNNVPFYIGISASPESRYYAHITSSLSKCYKLVRFCIKHFGLYPNINIIDSCRGKDGARRLENKYIVDRVNSGIELLNLRFIKLDNIDLPKGRIIPPHILIKLKRQVIEFKTKDGQKE